MQWLEIKVTFKAPDVDLATDLIADLFYDLGAKGVVVDDPVFDVGQDWSRDSLPPPDKPAVIGYLPVDEHLNPNRKALDRRLTVLASENGIAHDIQYRRIDEEDWAESWKAFFQPQKISDLFIVKPSWHHYLPAEGEQIIEIDPGMAFGTGTHPSTTLCVQLLETYLLPGQAVLDVGTGSGILLVAAHKLGAAQLCGVDSDPIAIEVARHNLVRNGIRPAGFRLHGGHLIQAVDRRFDLVIANILADVILDLLDMVHKVLRPGGHFICSGIIAAYEGKVAEKMVARGLNFIEARQQGDWVALVGRSA